jgi:D-alanyl-D-alanine carboxypeptidase
VIVVVLGGETAAARDNQVAYLVEGAYEEYARREDPSAATFASLPTRRLDAQTPGSPATVANGASSPYSTYQGMVVETMSAVQAPLDGQGDQAEETTEDME